jgi:Flp pilus assembly protein TadG
MRASSFVLIGTRSRRRDRRGVAAVEFALIAGALMTLLLGVYDIGNAIQQRLVLQQALRAGGLYAVSFPTQSDGIAAAINAALPASWQANVTVTPPRMWCTCSGSGTTDSCPLSCAGGTPQVFVTLGVSRPYSPYLFRALGDNTASYVVRVQ